MRHIGGAVAMFLAFFGVVAIAAAVSILAAYPGSDSTLPFFLIIASPLILFGLVALSLALLAWRAMRKSPPDGPAGDREGQ